MKISTIIVLAITIIFFTNTMDQQIMDGPLTFKVKAFVADTAQDLALFAQENNFSLESGLGAIFLQLGEKRIPPEININNKNLALEYASACLKIISNNWMIQANINKVIKTKQEWAKHKSKKTHEDYLLAKKNLQKSVNSRLIDLLKGFNHLNFNFPPHSASSSSAHYKYQFFQLNENIDVESHIPLVAGELIARGFLNQYIENIVRTLLKID